MQNLTISLVQTNLIWENPEANRAQLSAKLANLTQPTDLIILPEMFTTGFTMNAAPFAETMDGPTVNWLATEAHQKNAVIMGSCIIRENEKYYNRLLWMRPNGTLAFYDKRHLFRMAGETEVYTPGTQQVTVELHGWRLSLFVCYDLRFPVWSRNVKNQYDVLINVANWPAKRNYAWKALLHARAIENLAYAVGVNRVGTDGAGHEYTGDSSVYGPAGELLYTQTFVEDCVTVTLDHQKLVTFREAFPAYLDADEFTLL